VRSRVITHDGHIVQRLDSEVISNTALLAAPLIPRFEAFKDAQLLTAAHDIERLQEFLAAQGLATGPIDGRFGPLTRRAIEDYEARVGLPISGLATQILLKRLETTTSASAAR
jgi:peptidoglycan hydrolase-like protein with peptidoglycan-binding domain